MARASVVAIAFTLVAGCAETVPPKVAAKPREPLSRAPTVAAAPPTPPTAKETAPPKFRDALTAPPVGNPFGPGGPFTFSAADPNRRWVAVCQATHDTNRDALVSVSVSPRGGTTGDALEAFFVPGDGPPEAVDAFVGSDPSGRFVALIVHHALILRDTAAGTDTDLSALGADTRDDLASYLHPRAGSFDSAGKRFLYLRTDATGSRVVVRDLTTSSEVQVAAPAGSLYRADFDPSSEWIVLRVVTTDTDENGRLEWPAPEAPAPEPRCTGPLPRYAAWERPRDEPATFVVRATGGTPMEAPGLVTPLGDDVIVREDDATLARLSLDGKRTLVSRKGCASRLLHADSSRRELLFTCTEKPGKHTAVLYGPKGPKDLGLTMAAAAGDHVAPFGPTLFPLHPGTDAALVNLDSGDVELLRSGDRILGTAAQRALVLRGRSLVLHEFHGADTRFTGDVDAFGHHFRTGSVFFVPPFVVDVERGTLLGQSSARALALASDGSLLVAGGASADATKLAVGPLAWISPKNTE